MVRARILFSIIAVAAVTVAASSAVQQRSASRPDVILILVDTLRSDHLGASGYARDTSPAIDRLIANGVYFERFYAHASATRPSVATLFTSRLVSNHGVASHGTEGLADELVVLPELLQRAGYHTMGFVTNPQIHPRLGFDQGFDSFDSLFASQIDPANVRPQDLVKKPAGQVLALVKQRLQATERKPVFAYVHLVDPHGPYRAHPELELGFTDPNYSGNVTGSITDFARLDLYRRSPADLAHFRALYDEEIAFMDKAIGDFVGWLEASGRMSDTHLLITSDHGEEFMEHGSTGHGMALYEESVRIPLVWVGPGVPKGKRIANLAGLIDVMPTLADVLGLANRPEFQGQSLEPLWSEGSAAAGRSEILLEGVGRGTVRRGLRWVAKVTRALVTDSHKVIAHDCVLGEPACERFEILDLRSDPGEQSATTLAAADGAAEPEQQRWAELYLSAIRPALRLSAPADIPRAELPPEDVQQLEALGYVER